MIPRWVEVDARGVRVENLRQFGGQWLALHLIRTLGLDKALPVGRELIGWDVTSLIPVIGRLLKSASEQFTAEQCYSKTALPVLLGVAAWKKLKEIRDWSTRSAGCHLLRTNVTDWSDEDLWKAYIQLTEAEAAF